MRKYIKDLTDNLIGENNYVNLLGKLEWKEFLTFVKLDLDGGSVRDMKPETLGKIMFSLELGDVMSKNPGAEVGFAGDCGDYFREVVALCLAYVIRERLLNACNTHLTPYRPVISL